MKKLVVLLFFALNSFVSYSAQIPFTTRTDSLGNIKNVRISNCDTKNQLSDSEDFFKTVLNTSKDDTFQRITLKRDSFTHERFQQYYRGIKVEKGEYALHYKDNQIISANGNYIAIESLDIVPKITEEEAVNIYARMCGVTQYKILIRPELIICKGRHALEKEPLLAYKISLSSDSILIKDTGYINAKDGSLIKTESNIVCYSSMGNISTIYNGTLSTNTSYYNGAYHLCDSTRGSYIHVWNQLGASSIYPTYCAEYYDNDHCCPKKNLRHDLN